MRRNPLGIYEKALPPGLSWPERLAVAKACGFEHVGWAPAGFLGDELPSDKYPNAKLLDQALRTIKPGDILLALTTHGDSPRIIEAIRAAHERDMRIIVLSGADGLGITVAYWKTEADIAAWKANADHLAAQRAGAERWYEHYEVRVAKVERAYGKR